MKLFLISVFATLLCVNVHSLYGQSSSDVYIIGTSITAPGKFTGFDRMPPKSGALYATPRIPFIIRSVEKNVEIWLVHYNFNLEELRKRRPVMPDDTMVILDKPISELAGLNAIDVETVLAMSQSDAWEWANSVVRKRIFIIDRNDFYKSSASLSANDRMKLIQVGFQSSNQPEPDRGIPVY